MTQLEKFNRLLDCLNAARMTCEATVSVEPFVAAEIYALMLDLGWAKTKEEATELVKGFLETNEITHPEARQ